jgi:hypothetical protein
MADNPYADLPIKELLKHLETKEPGTIHHEQLKMTINFRYVENLENSINNLRDSITHMTTSNDKLGTKIFWLNLILTGATVIGVIIAFLEYVC